MATPTLVLVGDSILDNEPYTRPRPCTIEHLQRLLPGWSVQRAALDGSIIADISSQLRDIEERPDVMMLSVGGNDALEHVDLLTRSASSSAEVLVELLQIANDFEARYEAVARSCTKHTERLVLCTIYEVQLEPKLYADLARVPLGLLNDRIIRVGSRVGADVLELRSVCTEPSDFVLQIEPSPRGAEKIARAIAALVSEDKQINSTRVYNH